MFFSEHSVHYGAKLLLLHEGGYAFTSVSHDSYLKCRHLVDTLVGCVVQW